MDQGRFCWVYHPANSEDVIGLEQKFSASGLSFEHCKCLQDEPPGTFAQKIEDLDIPAVFFISDNFLKSEKCLTGFLEVWRSLARQDRTVNIVIDGKHFNKESNKVEVVETDFSRMSGVIKYINYWQESYLDLRSHLREVSGEEADELEEKLQIVRTISTEIGDFLRLLREGNLLYYNELGSENFQPLKHAMGVGDMSDDYWKQLAEEAEEEITEAAKIENLAPEKEVDEEPVQQDSSELSYEAGESTEMKPETVPEPVSETFDYQGDSARHPKTEYAPLPFENEEETDDEDENEEFFVEELESIEKKPVETREPAVKYNDPYEGEEIFEKSIAESPDDIGLRYEYALFLARELGNYPKAIRQLDVVLEQDKEHSGAYLLLGELSELHQDHKAALEYYQKAVEANPYTPDVHLRIGMLLYRYFEGKEKKAGRYFKNAFKQNPENVDALYYYATILNEHKGKYIKAIEAFKKVLSMRPGHPFAYYDLALIYHRLGDMEKAADHYVKAANINPELRNAGNDKAFGIESGSAGEEALIDEEVTLEEGENGTPKKDEAIAVESDVLKQEEKVNRRTILITGATSGIGKATAVLFAENGYRLILTGRRLERLEALQKEFKDAYNAETLLLNFDVRDRKAVDAAISSIPEEWREVDILLNNAGLAKGLAPIHEGDFNHWETMIDTNLKGLLYMTRLIAPHMVSRRKGHIINVASTAGKEVYPSGNVYCATKFAVDALTRAMRLDLHKHNIRVSQVAPGHVEETEFALVRFDGDADKAKIYEDFRPLTSHDVAEAIYFIATRPPHVDILDLLLTGTQQASVSVIDRSGRQSD